MAVWSQALSKLVFFVICIPFSITFLQLSYTSQRANLVFVGPAQTAVASSLVHKTEAFHSTEETQNVYGVYQAVFANKQQAEPTVFSHLTGVSSWHDHWPSIARLSTILATPTSTLLRRASGVQVTPAQITYETNQWCLQSESSARVCSTLTTTDSVAPPSGDWTSSTGDSFSAIRVSYQGPSMSKVMNANQPDSAASSDQTFRRNPNKRSKRNRNLEQVLLRPTTTLLLALNVLIAFIYWNRQTNPSSVSKIYSKIVEDGELWRSFTGATAHFEPLHLGFNMMTLFSLGTELEPSYGSIPFLLYNISLIPMTTCIMMGMTYLQIRQTGNVALRDTSTVGYSGVLFAWMVIASLERSEVCPIPFFPTVCFSTFEIYGNFRINIGPLVQMGVMQVIMMKRVSLVGHLAGVIAGFLLHWNLLPLEWIQPVILLPVLHLVYLWRVRHLVPVTPQPCNDVDDVEEASCRFAVNESPNGRFDSRRNKRERDQAMHRLLVYVRYSWIVVIVACALVVDLFGAMLLSSILCTLWYHFCVQSHALLLLIVPSNSQEFVDLEKSRLGTLWKGFIIANVLTIVCDSMALGGWFVGSVLWQGTKGVGLTPVCIVLAIRVSLEIISLALACKSMADIGELGSGTFVTVFGSTILENARIVGSALVASITSTNWTAFEGRGHRSGTVNDSGAAVET